MGSIACNSERTILALRSHWLVMARTVSLSRHLMLSKTMRAVFVFDPSNVPDRETFTWLASQHQYQNIGIPASIYDAPEFELDAFETYSELRLPNDALNELRDASTSEHPDWVIESLLLASAYVVPMCLQRGAVDEFEQFTEWKALTATHVPEDQVTRHLRIIGHGMQSLFEDTTENALNAFHRSDIHSEIVRRQTVAEEDGTERLWRLLDTDEEGETWIGGYFDVLPALPDAVSTSMDGEAAIGLALVGGLMIDPPYP
jgi:hypothetical protein